MLLPQLLLEDDDDFQIRRRAPDSDRRHCVCQKWWGWDGNGDFLSKVNNDLDIFVSCYRCYHFILLRTCPNKIEGWRMDKCPEKHLVSCWNWYILIINTWNLHKKQIFATVGVYARPKCWISSRRFIETKVRVEKVECYDGTCWLALIQMVADAQGSFHLYFSRICVYAFFV